MVCVICGATNPAEARFCLSCGAALSPAPAEPSPERSAHVVVSLEIARLGDRFLALILDSALLAAVFLVGGMWMASRWGGLTESGFDMTGGPALLTIGALLAAGFLYYWLLEGLFGATLGKAIVGVAVCDVEGRRCGFRRSFIRNLLRLVDGVAAYLIGLLIALFSKRRQRLGDHLAGTYVVERAVGAFGRGLVALLWLAALGSAIWGTVAVRRGAAPGVAETVAAPTPAATPGPTPSTAPGASPTLAPTRSVLEVRELTFLGSEGGSPRAAGPVKAGEQVFAAFKVTGLTTDAQGQIHLYYAAEAMDANGLRMDQVSRELQATPGPAGLTSVSVSLRVPAFAPPGASKVRVTARDDLKKTEAELAVPFAIDAPPPVVSSQLEIRNLRLSLSEGGPRLDPAVVKAGVTLHVAGNLAGMKLREDQIDVVIAFQVLGPDGQIVLDNPTFIEVKGSYPYHPPSIHVPIIGDLRLPPDAAKGAYRERYVVTDRIGGATRTHELTFTLE